MVLEEELEKLKKLSPSERIKRLRELEEQKKEEIEEAEKLLTDAKREASAEEEERLQLPIPHMKAVSPDTIETIEARLLWAAKRGITLKPAETETAAPLAVTPGRRLEEAVEGEHERAARARAAHAAGVQYGSQLAEAVRSQTGASVIEAYTSKESKAPGDEYASITKQKEMAYQKPESRAEFTYETRKATPGHEAERQERQPQDFYTTTAQEKEKKKKATY